MAIISSMRLPRPFHSEPVTRKSSGHGDSPTPNPKRLSVRTASEAACLATSTGGRMASFTTNVVKRSRSVRAPRKATWVKGSRKAVAGSGTTSMSLSWISWKPRIDEPSKPMPSANMSASNSVVGIEKCCQTPGKSVKRTSTILTSLSLIAASTSSGVAHVSAMGSTPLPA